MKFMPSVQVSYFTVVYATSMVLWFPSEREEEPWLAQRMFQFVGLRRRQKNLSFILLCLSRKPARSNGCVLDVIR